jgi:hypothetical protein
LGMLSLTRPMMQIAPVSGPIDLAAPGGRLA